MRPGSSALKKQAVPRQDGAKLLLWLSENVSIISILGEDVGLLYVSALEQNVMV